jgi:hypothetical protein
MLGAMFCLRYTLHVWTFESFLLPLSGDWLSLYWETFLSFFNFEKLSKLSICRCFNGACNLWFREKRIQTTTDNMFYLWKTSLITYPTCYYNFIICMHSLTTLTDVYGNTELGTSDKELKLRVKQIHHQSL